MPVRIALIKVKNYEVYNPEAQTVMIKGFKTGLMALRTAIPATRTFAMTSRLQSEATKQPTVFEPLPPKRNGQNVMQFLHKNLLNKYDPTGKRRALVAQSFGLRAGDIIKVTYSDRTSVIGQIIAIKRGVNNVGTNILIRNKINKLGVEVRIPLYNPKIRNIETLYKPEKYMPRRKHFYIRNSKYDVGDIEAFLSRQKKK